MNRNKNDEYTARDEYQIPYQEGWADELSLLSNIDFHALREQYASYFESTNRIIELVGLSPVQRRHMPGYKKDDTTLSYRRFRIQLNRRMSYCDVTQWFSGNLVAHVNHQHLTMKVDGTVVRQAVRTCNDQGVLEWTTTGERMWVRYRPDYTFAPASQSMYLYNVAEILRQRYVELGGDPLEEDPQFPEIEHEGAMWIKTTEAQRELRAALIAALPGMTMKSLKQWADRINALTERVPKSLGR